MTLKRLAKEKADFEKESELQISTGMCQFQLQPSHSAAAAEDPLIWSVTLFGPKDSPYDGGCFSVRLVFPGEYPMKAPSMHFETKIFHPNIDWAEGAVCMDSLASGWSPAWGPRTLLEGVPAPPPPPFPLSFQPHLCSEYTSVLQVLSLLTAPAQGADSPLNCDAANLLRPPNGDPRCFNSVAKM
jgi:ubiquitin-protein ligase